MKVITRHYFLNDNNEKFFGEGPYRLLKKVEETGSLHASAFALGMAYSKASKLLKNAEESLGFPLTVRKIGGKAGGGSVLTDEAIDFITRYEAYRNECLKQETLLYEKYFGTKENVKAKYGCVIMASGLGRRFGGDKLMAELSGKPMIQYIVDATEKLFPYRVVVTRNENVKNWCEKRNINVIFHELPGRNDTIRLGLEELEKNAGENTLSGCVFCPGDMPFVTKDAVTNMLSMAEKEKMGIFRMAYGENIGAPVLFSSKYFEELKKLPQGKGGSEVIKKYQNNIHLIECKNEYELWDMDSQEDYERIKEKILELEKK